MSGKSLNSCVTCGHKLRFFDSFCPVCGTTRHIQCESCGNIYNLSASHCPACGSVNLVPNQGTSLFINLISIFIVFVVIIIGSILLVCPFTHEEGAQVSYVNALFTATTATCVTGLVDLPAGIGATFNLGGEIIILILNCNG